MDVPMVQMIENHAEIGGELLGIADAPDRPGFVILTVKVATADAVGGSPNFFERDIGQTIAIVARAGSGATRCAPGPVRLAVRKAGPGVSFAEGD